MIRASLKLQLAGAIVVIELVMLSLLLFSTLNLLSNTYEERLADSADNIARQYAATAARYLFEADMPSLDEYSRQVASHEELTAIDVFDRNRRLIYSFSEDPAPSRAAQGGALSTDDNTFDVAAEINLAGQVLGEARLVFSLDVLNASIATARVRGIAIAAAEIVLTIIVGLWISGRLTAGLRSLSNAAEQYGAGKLDVVVDVASQNEIGRTASAFNQMIEDRKRAGVQLQRSEARFRALVENSKDLIMVLSDDNRVQFVSPSVEQILGHGRESVVGQDLSTTFGDAGSARIVALLSALAEQPSKVVREEVRATHADGSDVFIELIAQSYLHEPDVGGIVLNCWDITDRKHVEEQLRQSAKLEAVGSLTGGVAHDFNNLLAVVLGNLELLKGEAIPKEAVTYIDDAIGATLRGADLTKSMLSFARKAPLEPTRIDLNDVVRSTKNWSVRVLPETIDVETSLLAGLWPVEADLSSAQNAILNLMVNARDAMPNGGKLTLETANIRIDDDYIEARDEDLQPGRYVMLAVSDTGSGIPKDQVERIFEPFYTTKGPGDGSGLGLSMVQGFMRQTEGTVRVYSEPGEGSTFKLYFRALTDPSSTDVAPRRQEVSASTPGARVLMAEDEPGVMKVLSRALRNSGYEVVEANSGDEALRVFHLAGKFDLLLTDIVMPGNLQGPALARKLRELDPELPAIFMSGYANEATVHGNGLRPEDIRLMKPVRKDDLVRAVEKAVSLRKAARRGTQ